MAVVVIILVLVLAVVGAYFAHLEHPKLLAAMQTLAARLGWSSRRITTTRTSSRSSRFFGADILGTPTTRWSARSTSPAVTGR